MKSSQKVFALCTIMVLPLVYFMHRLYCVDLHYKIDVKRAIIPARLTLPATIPATIPTTEIATVAPTTRSSSSHLCTKRFCAEFLTPGDKYAFNACVKHAEVQEETRSCKFMNQTLRLPVALASFPGSGNTWVRGLLEQTTGICTGSVYCDTSLRRSGGFIGESIRSGAVLVTKTHYPAVVRSNSTINGTTGATKTRYVLKMDPRTGLYSIKYDPKTHYINPKTLNGIQGNHGDPSTLYNTTDPRTLHKHLNPKTHYVQGNREYFKTLYALESENPYPLYGLSNDSNPAWGAAIVIVRNPFPALVAEYTRRRTNYSHVDSLERDRFGNHTIWNHFVYDFASKWQNLIEFYFVNDFQYSKLCVVYENLKVNPLFEVRRMLEFLNVTYSERELKSQLQQPIFTFQRDHKEDFDHFTPKQRYFVNSVIGSTIEALKHSKFVGQIPLQQYLRYDNVT